jgi:hypothetical protein
MKEKVVALDPLLVLAPSRTATATKIKRIKFIVDMNADDEDCQRGYEWRGKKASPMRIFSLIIAAEPRGDCDLTDIE